MLNRRAQAANDSKNRYKEKREENKFRRKNRFRISYQRSPVIYLICSYFPLLSRMVDRL